LTSIIELEDVSVGYRERPVFTHLSLSFVEGRLTGIVGPTGSGKTTLLKTILGVQDYHGGRVTVMGHDTGRIPAGSIGYVPQLETVDWTFPVTVSQVMLMGLYTEQLYWPWLGKKSRHKVVALAEKLGIDDCLNHHIRDISGGQQQRAFLGRALISSPKILILDEPTSGVDIKTQHDVLHLLFDLAKEGVTILLTTHDLNAVAAHLEWIICFNKKLIAQGAPVDVFSEQVLTATYGGQLVVVNHNGQLMVSHAALSPRGNK